MLKNSIIYIGLTDIKSNLNAYLNKTVHNVKEENAF